MSSHLEHPYELPHSIRGSLKPFHSCFPWSLSSCQNLSKVSLLRTFTPVVYKNIQFYNNDNSKDVWRYSNMHSTSNHALMILPCLSRPKHKFIHGTVLVVLYIILQIQITSSAQKSSYLHKCISKINTIAKVIRAS